jgi:hypothetical protein
MIKVKNRKDRTIERERDGAKVALTLSHIMQIN